MLFEKFQLELLILGGILLLKLLTDWIPTIFYLFYKPKTKQENNKPVSVIICARNEADNLLANLPKILEQDYPEFEVVVVNDRSIDDSHLVLRALANKYCNLSLTKVQDSELHWAGKKFALSLGLKAAKYNHVLLTDADCHPSSNAWLKEMAGAFSEKHKIVLGYGAYLKRPGVLNYFIRMEALSIAHQYIASALMGVPYMAVGRNLAYDKNLFFNNRGFASHQFMPSGDDDLFVNEVANHKNTTIQLSENSFTLSEPERTFKDWIHQKRRHLTTGSRYNVLSKLWLLWISLVKYAMYLIFLIMPIISELPWWFVAIAWGVNAISLIFQHLKIARITQSVSLLFGLAISEMFLLLFYPFLFFWNTFVSGSPWKNY